jgi:hypothetical protein
MMGLKAAMKAEKKGWRACSWVVLWADLMAVC